MKLDQDVITIADIDLFMYRDLIENIFNIDWQNDMFTRHDDLNLTGRSAVIFFNFTNTSFANYTQNLTSKEVEIKLKCMDLINYVLSYFEDFIAVKGEISCCFPDSSQKFHIDPRIFHRYSKRIHVPLYTNQDAYLEIEGNRYHLGENKIYEFNNMKKHRSLNLGKENRIHLILDIIKKEDYTRCIKKFGKTFFARVPEKFECQSLA